jgi:hypothetical protein
MGTKAYKKKSNDASADSGWLALDLPVVKESQAPLTHAAPSSTLALAHSMELLKSTSEATWIQRRALMHPVRFTM